MMEVVEEKVPNVRQSMDFLHNVFGIGFIGGFDDNRDCHGYGIIFRIMHNIGYSLYYIGALKDAHGRPGTPVRYSSYGIIVKTL